MRTKTRNSIIDSDELNAIKQFLIRRLTGKAEDSILVGTDRPYKALYGTLERSIRNGESNSAIIVGPRGSGKSTLMKRVFYDIDKEFQGTYYLIKLSGLVHINDRIALKAIASQLNQNMNVEDSVNRSAAEWMNFLISMFQNGDKNSTPVVFVLEHVDLFAMQPKQLLLYTLFDIAQSRQAPVAVVGITSRMNVVDLLEKRVKSRFSHRLIHVPLASNSEEFFMIAFNNLLLPVNGESGIDPKFARQFNDKAKECLFGSVVSDLLNHIFNLGKDVSLMFKLMVLAVSAISINDPFLSSKKLISFHRVISLDQKSGLLNEVSLLEFYLLVSMKYLISTGHQVFNFEMVYDEYKKMASQYIMSSTLSGGSIKIYKKPVALKAYEYLLQIEFIQPCSSISASAGGGVFVSDNIQSISSRKKGSTFGSGNGMKEFQMVKLLLDPNELGKAAETRRDVPMAVKRWFLES